MTAEKAREIAQSNGVNSDDVISKIEDGILTEAKKGFHSYVYYVNKNPIIIQHFENKGFNVTENYDWNEGHYLTIDWWK